MSAHHRFARIAGYAVMCYGVCFDGPLHLNAFFDVKSSDVKSAVTVTFFFISSIDTCGLRGHCVVVMCDA